MKLSDIGNMSIESLLNPDNISKLQSALDIMGKIKDGISVMEKNDNSNRTNILKAGTTLTMAMILKMRYGKLPSDYTQEDWNDVVNYVSEYAVYGDEIQYSIYVFMLYAHYIEYSLNRIEGKLSEEKTAAIQALSDEIKSKTEQLNDETITETQYIDDCLWLCLEAMLKLLSGTIDAKLGFEEEKVAEAVAVFSLEYGRYKLYKKEHDLLEECLEHQYELDERLQAEYDSYIRKLSQESEQFNNLINSAFNNRFADSLKASVKLARAAGVGENEIITALSETDEYFMS